MSGSHPLTLRLYRMAMTVASPFAGLVLAIRQRRGKEDGKRRPERRGIAGLPRPAGRLCWLHGASVGESITLLPLAERLSEEGFRVLMTTGTVTSAELMARRLPPGAIHQFVPLDVPAFVRRFLRHWRPDLAIFVESELWPGMISEISAAGIPLALVNGRMSPRSFVRWRRAPRTIGALLSAFDLVAAQSLDDAGRFSALGAPQAVDTGNLKFDAPPPPADARRLEALQHLIGARPLWVAASTHEGEEALIGRVHAQLKLTFPNILTIIAPRHPERGAAIARELRAQGLVVAERSREQAPEADTDIYLADTVGELGMFYRLSSVVFLGKSLIGDGGHNPVEPAKLGAAVLHGPFVHNFVDTYEVFNDMHGAVLVNDGEELAQALNRLFSNPREIMRLADGGARAVAALSGALERTLWELAPLMAKSSQPQARS